MQRALVLASIALSTSCATGAPSSGDGGVADAGSLVEVERGPVALAIDGDPNGLFFDAVARELLLADDDQNRILRFRDGEGFSLRATLPAAAGESPGLGQVVQLSDGTLLVPRFGYGTTGDIVRVEPDGASATIADLDPVRRRIGLAVTANDVVYGTFFTTNQVQGGLKEGSLSRLTDDGEGNLMETIVASGLEKPVGVLATSDTLYVADQDRGHILKTPLSTPGELSLVAEVESADLLTVDDTGNLYTGGRTGTVFRVTPNGEVSAVVTGLREVRGLAFDAENSRLFVVDHDGSGAGDAEHFVRIEPID